MNTLLAMAAMGGLGLGIAIELSEHRRLRQMAQTCRQGGRA